MDPNDFEIIQEYRQKDLDTNSFYIGLDISPCGQYLASGSRDSNVYIWDCLNPLKNYRLLGHKAETTAVAWSPRGLELASCSDDMTCRIWEPSTESNIDPTSGHCEEMEPPLINTTEANNKLLTSSSSTLTWTSYDYNSSNIIEEGESMSDPKPPVCIPDDGDKENTSSTTLSKNPPTEPLRVVKRDRPITAFFHPLPKRKK